MKPLVIIVIAVGCSVVAVLGVLFVLQEIAFYQAQVEFDEYQSELARIESIEKEKNQAAYDENRELCNQAYPDVMSKGSEEYQNAYLYCLNYGVEEALFSECAKMGIDRINCSRMTEEELLNNRP